MKTLVRKCNEDNEFKGETIFEYTAESKKDLNNDDD